jgi:PKD repeat protein
MVAPYAAAPDFRLQSTSPALTGANFTNPKLATGFTPVAYKGAFGGTDNWTDCWAEFSPQDEDYSNDSINYGVTAQISNSGPLTFCTGGSVALTASSSVPGSSYLWSTGGSSPTINPTASGTYRVTVTSPRGCKTTASKVVVVNPNPPVPTITSSSTSFCTGDNGVTLTGSNASKYSWSNGDTTSSITVNSPGTYRLTVTNANQCSAQSAVIQITENIPVVPAISASGSTSFCVGDSVSINITNSNNFNSFAWSNNKVAQSITVTNSGVYSVITTDNNGCTASSNSITISVSNSPTPTISANGDINLCSGDTVTLTSSQSDTYLWSNNATTRSINVTTSGSYNVSVTNANVCNGIGTSNTITVTVTPQPVAGFTQNVNGASVNFISNSSNATSYNWTFGDGGSSNSQDPSHTYGANGTYTVTLTTTNGICSDVSTGSVTITTVGVKEIKNAIENIRLFPNPNYGVATLEIITSDFSDAVISVYDVAGRDVLKINSELINGTNAINISTNEFAAGVYFVNVRNESNNKIIRMIVSK